MLSSALRVRVTHTRGGGGFAQPPSRITRLEIRARGRLKVSRARRRRDAVMQGRDLEGPVEIKTPPHEETKHSA